MERRNAILRLTIAWLLPGAMMGALVGLGIAYAGSRQPEMWKLLGLGTGFGAGIGALVGALIGDHRFPP